jgi:Flp pilus assembly protein TadD
MSAEAPLPFATAPRRTVLEEPAEDAILAFRKAAEAHPREPDYRFMLGDALMRVGRFEAAAAEMRAACALGPPNAEYLCSVGAVLLEAGRYDEADDALRASLALDPTGTQALARRGVVLAHLGRASEARRSSEEACRLDSGSAESVRFRGIVLWQLGDAPAALASLLSAVRLAPDSPEAHHDLGLALAASGRGAEAVATFEKTVELDPSFLGARPASREIVDRCRLEALRSEMAPRRSTLARGAAAALSAVDAIHEAARGGPRLARRVLGGWTLFAALLIAYLCIRVVPPYAAHFRLQDRMREIARVPLRDDGEIHARLMREVEELGLVAWVHPDDCAIGTKTSFRTIVCVYQRPIPLVPGFAPRVSFRARVEVAVIFGPDTTFF